MSGFPQRQPVNSVRVTEIVASIVRGISDPDEFGGYVYRVSRHHQNYCALRVYYANGSAGQHYKLIRVNKNTVNAVLDQLNLSRYRPMICVSEERYI